MALTITWPKVGDRFQNNQGHWYTVVEINRSDNIIIEFDEDKFRKKTTKQYILTGCINLPKVRVGQLYKDKLGNDVQVVNVDGTNRVTFRWGDGYERVCQSGVIDLNTLMREEDSRQLNPSFKCGDKGKLKDGTPWEIISYTTYSNIKIKVMTEPPWETTVSGGNLASGSIRNRGKPSLFGVGILGDAEVNCYDMRYKSWAGMIKRVYNPHTEQMAITYKDCTVVKEWLRFENYLKWFEQQKVQPKWQLDKDLLVPGNKIYGPDTCIFLPREINTFLTNRYNHRGQWPVGVTYHERLNKWQASCNAHGKSEYLGVFTSPEEAFATYKVRKEQVAKELAEMWRDKIDIKAYNALMKFEVHITD